MIAIVDDDPSVRSALKRLLRTAGHMVATYASGDDFLRSLQRGRPDCLILDLHMPNVDGFDVLALLARESANIAVIVVTADGDAKTAARVMRLGARACLQKPIDQEVLEQALRTALRHGETATPPTDN